MSTSPTPEELPASVVLKRRLIGLLVLLLFLFLLSVLLRAVGQPAPVQEEGLQTVVVPLGGGELPPVVANPEPEPEPLESDSVTEPLAEKPAAPEAATVETRPKPAPATPASAPTTSKPPKPAAKPTTPPPAAKPQAKTPPPPVKPQPKPAAPPAASTKAPEAVARWYVVLGTFSDASNAKALVLRARQSGFRAELVPIKSGGVTRNRVRAGPFKSEAEGQGARATLIVEGMTGAKLVKEP